MAGALRDHDAANGCTAVHTRFAFSAIDPVLILERSALVLRIDIIRDAASSSFHGFTEYLLHGGMQQESAPA